ncbi:MAG TPA: M20/M25/M40 family metallo-hydrolase [Kofleriaceae bacterium]|nr:M20/M25/M40 family metallo-hydrolase [Kofleriaceae bacterium]
MVRASLAIAALLAGCSHPGPDPRLQPERMRAQVDTLTRAIGPRPYNSPGARRAVRFISDELARLGLTVEHLPVGHIIHPPLDVLGRRVFPRTHVDVNDPNLLVRIAAADPSHAGDPALLLMAHYDTVPGTPGAVDNAASVALLLDLARILSASPPPRPVLLVWTAAEEIRLSGSTRLVEALRDGVGASPAAHVGAAIALDLVGASDAVTLNGLSRLIGLPWLRRLARAARAAGDVHAPALYRLASRRLPETERSDHGPFTAVGIPAFHLYSRGADRIYLPYHSPRDTPDLIHWDGVLATGTFLLALIEDDSPLPDAGGDAGWWLELPGGPRALPSALLIALEALLAAIALTGIVQLFRRRARRASAAQPAPAVPARGFDARGLIGFASIYAIAWSVAGAAMLIDRLADGHPAPWLHAPVRAYLACALIAGGLALPLAGLAARLSPPVRPAAGRLLGAAIVLLLLAAAALLALAAPELALPPLLGAALLGAAALCRRARFAAPLAVAGLLPTLAVLDPALAREGFFHDFTGDGFPVVLALALALAPVALVAVWAWQSWGRPLPRRGRPGLVLVLLPAALALLAAGLLVADQPPCSGAHFSHSGLYCEIDRD